MSRIIFSFLLLFPSLLISCQSTNDSSSAIKNVSADEFRKIIENTDVILVDVRTSGEFTNGHIDGAIMMDFYKKGFREQILTLDKNKTILLYCRSGNRSYQTARFLEGQGYKNIYNLKSGVIDWSRSNYKLMAGD